MKRLGMILAAVAAIAVAAPPLAAYAQREGRAGRDEAAKPAAAAPAQGKLPPITDKQREQGKAEAPAAVQAAKLACMITDSYFVQGGTDPKTKAKANIYEVACQEGPGFIIQTSGDTAAGYDCLAQIETAKREAAAGRPGSLVCRLPGNADPKQGLAKIAAGLGFNCAASDARVMGATAAGDTYYELACQGDRGYVIQTSRGKPPVGSDCIQTLGGGATECTLTSKAQILASLGRLAAPSNKPCTVSDARLVGTDKASGSTFYEVACGSTPGFMLQANAQGAYQNAIDCSKAQTIGGGCSLTVVDETAEAGTYTKLAQGANFPCDVSRYRYLGKEEKTNSEIVELACKNRPDGGIGMFPINAGKPAVFDCLQGGSLGVTCQLTPASALYAKYTERLVAQGKTQCKVSGAKYLASTTSGADFIETACSDGLPGFVISVDHTSGATKELLTCGQVGRSGAACTLPTNVAKN